MAFIPISQLTQTFSPSGTDVVPIVSNNTTYKISASDIVAGSAVNYGETTFYQPGWYLNIKGIQTTTISYAINTTTFSLFPVNRNCQIQSISVNVATASVSGIWSAGLYGPAPTSYGNRIPGNLIANLGTASTTATGISTINFSPITLLANYGGGYNSGLYSIGILTQLSPCYLNCQIGFMPYAAPSSVSNQYLIGYAQTNDTGGLPGTPYTSYATTTTPMWYWLQYV